jgi:hypothetical protein
MMQATDTADDLALSLLALPDETTPDWFPELGTMSPAFLFRFVPVPDVEPEPPEYVYLKPPTGRRFSAEASKFFCAIPEWN